MIPPPPPKPTFDPTMWDQLVYDAYDEGAPEAFTWLLDDTPMNIRIVTTEEDGTVSITAAMVTEIEAAFRETDAWLTERRFFGRIEVGTHDPDPGNTMRGWITVTPRNGGDFCGKARRGGQPGRIWLPRFRADAGCRLHRNIRHEIGHALGFDHVDGLRYPDAVMGVYGSNLGRRPTAAIDFSSDERYHMRLGVPCAAALAGVLCDPADRVLIERRTQWRWSRAPPSAAARYACRRPRCSTLSRSPTPRRRDFPP